LQSIKIPQDFFLKGAQSSLQIICFGQFIERPDTCDLQESLGRVKTVFLDSDEPSTLELGQDGSDPLAKLAFHLLTIDSRLIGNQ
jgi:hypothetical protein